LIPLDLIQPLSPTFIQTPTYPTRSLNFLLKLQVQSEVGEVKQALYPLNIIISGAGLGGLATAIALARRGHHVTAFEQVEKLSEVSTSPINFLFLFSFAVGGRWYTNPSKLVSFASKFWPRSPF
jgi:hypothetical protein